MYHVAIKEVIHYEAYIANIEGQGPLLVDTVTGFPWVGDYRNTCSLALPDPLRQHVIDYS